MFFFSQTSPSWRRSNNAYCWNEEFLAFFDILFCNKQLLQGMSICFGRERICQRRSKFCQEHLLYSVQTLVMRNHSVLKAAFEMNTHSNTEADFVVSHSYNAGAPFIASNYSNAEATFAKPRIATTRRDVAIYPTFSVKVWMFV